MSAPVPLSDMIACARREQALRKNVYPTLVAKGRMEQSEADTEIARMSAIITTLEWLQANEAAIRGRVPSEDRKDG